MLVLMASHQIPASQSSRHKFHQYLPSTPSQNQRCQMNGIGVFVVQSIQKKGDNKECMNYRGTSHLNIAYKILASSFVKEAHVIEKVNSYQCGFRSYNYINANPRKEDQKFQI